MGLGGLKYTLKEPMDGRKKVLKNLNTFCFSSNLPFSKMFFRKPNADTFIKKSNS